MVDVIKLEKKKWFMIGFLWCAAFFLLTTAITFKFGDKFWLLSLTIFTGACYVQILKLMINGG